MHPNVAYQGEFWISTGIHTKLKVTGTKTHHGASFPGQDGRREQRISQAGPRRDGDQVGAGPLLPIQSVDESSQLLCVQLLKITEGDRWQGQLKLNLEKRGRHFSNGNQENTILWVIILCQ